jgi:hypothetical protein
VWPIRIATLFSRLLVRFNVATMLRKVKSRADSQLPRVLDVFALQF